MVRQLANPDVLQSLERHVEQYDYVLVPGFKNSGPEHWQSFWERDLGLFQRISQRRWDQRDIDLWVDAIGRQVADSERPAILIGHSLGALASACVIAEGLPGVAAAMFVAPAEPMRFEAEHRVPLKLLPVPTVLVASHTDTLISFARAKWMAENWGSEFVDVGEAGHINSEAGFGRWPYGLNILVDLIERIEPQATCD